MPLAILEPLMGKRKLAVTFDFPLATDPLQRQTVYDFKDKTGAKWSAYNFVQEIPETEIPPFEEMDKTMTDAAVYISVLPTKGWQAVTDKDIEDVAQRCKIINQNGRDVFLAFAPEMNTPFHIWGQQPTEFLRRFEQLSTLIQSTVESERTAMVWAPFDGTNYPYSGQYSPKPDSADFKILDTNNDGKLDNNDDPYFTFLPKNTTLVDWVGLSVYYQSNEGNNTVPNPNALSDILTGTINRQPNFYKQYSEDLDKPMMLSSSGAVFYKGDSVRQDNSPTELQIKASWWRQWLANDNFIADFPRVKLITISESANFHQDSKIWYDYRVANNTDVFSAFKKDLDISSTTITWSQSANLNTWNGTINNGGNSSAGNSNTVFSAYIIALIVCIPIIAVSVWIGSAFYFHLKRIERHEIAMSAKNSKSNRVKDDSTVLSRSSWDSQMTTSDDIITQDNSPIW